MGPHFCFRKRRPPPHAKPLVGDSNSNDLSPSCCWLHNCCCESTKLKLICFVLLTKHLRRFWKPTPLVLLKNSSKFQTLFSFREIFDVFFQNEKLCLTVFKNLFSLTVFVHEYPMAPLIQLCLHARFYQICL